MPDAKNKVRLVNEEEAEQMRKEMEDHRQAMLKSIEDSKARLKTLLHTNPQRHFDSAQQPASKPSS
jgi:DNA-binding TFAR19-related protein (PDSD5 family)